MSKALSARQLSGLLPHLLLLCALLVYFVYFGLYANQRYLAFETGAFDLGVYAQPLWNSTQGRGLAVSLIEDNGPSRWATHVEPILFLVTPLYRLWPDPRLLLWLQVAGVTLAGLPLFGLAARRLHHDWAALVVVLAYLLLPATEAVTLFDFHAVSLAPLFLLSAVYFMDRALAGQGQSFWIWPEESANERVGEWANPSGRRGQPVDTLVQPKRNHLDRAVGQVVEAPAGGGAEGAVAGIALVRSGPAPGSIASGSSYAAPAGRALGLPAVFQRSRLYLFSGLFFLLALSTKEDISLHVFMVGLYLAVLRRRWWIGGSLMAVGLAWFYVAFQVVIPAFRTGGGHSIYAAWFETLGRTPLEIALSPFTAPDKVLALLFRPGSLPALAMLLSPQALLPLAGLPLFLLAAPSLAFSLLSQNPTLRQLETWHYAAPMLPFVMLGTIDGMARLVSYGSAAAFRLRRPVSPATLLKLLILLLLVTTLGYHYLRGYSAIARLQEWPEVTAHHRLGREIAAKVPGQASVLAQAQLVPYVAHRQVLGIWSGPLFTDYDYIWLDLSHPRFPNRYNAHGDLLTGLLIEPDFGFAEMRDGYLLLQRGGERHSLAEELFTFTQFDHLPAGAQPASAMFGDVLELVGVKPEVRRLATPETEPQVVLYFKVRQKPAEDYFLFVYRIDEQGKIGGATDYPQPAVFWWPISRWEAGDQRQVRVNTIPWWTGDKAVFGYALGISRRNDPWDVAARLPVRLADGAVNPAGSQPVDQGSLLPLVAFRRLGGLPYPQPLTVLQLSGAE